METKNKCLKCEEINTLIFNKEDLGKTSNYCCAFCETISELELSEEKKPSKILKVKEIINETQE